MLATRNLPRRPGFRVRPYEDDVNWKKTTAERKELQDRSQHAREQHADALRKRRAESIYVGKVNGDPQRISWASSVSTQRNSQCLDGGNGKDTAGTKDEKESKLGGIEGWLNKAHLRKQASERKSSLRQSTTPSDLEGDKIGEEGVVDSILKSILRPSESSLVRNGPEAIWNPRDILCAPHSPVLSLTVAEGQRRKENRTKDMYI